MLSTYIFEVYLNLMFLAAFLAMTVSTERPIIHLSNRLNKILPSLKLDRFCVQPGGKGEIEITS